MRVLLIVPFLLFFLSGCGRPSDSIEDTLVFAIDSGDYASVEDILNRKVDLEALIGGLTPLMYAAGGNEHEPDYYAIEKGNERSSRERNLIVGLLLNKGANPNAKSEDGKTALHYAVVNGWLGTTWLLLKSGANPNQMDEFSSTPAWYAINHCHLFLLEMLIDYGAKLPSREDIEKIKNPECPIGSKFRT